MKIENLSQANFLYGKLSSINRCLTLWEAYPTARGVIEELVDFIRNNISKESYDNASAETVRMHSLLIQLIKDRRSELEKEVAELD